MRAQTPSSTIECYVVVPPQYRPQLSTDISFLNGNNLKATLTISQEKNENRIPLASGRVDIFQLGKPKNNLSLSITGADTETELVLDEIAARNIPVYVYPRAGAGLQFAMPLIRGLGTDPIDGPTVTYTLTTRAGTTIYMPHADAGHGLFLKAVDTAAPLIDGVQSGNGTLTQIPTGRGMPFWKTRLNYFFDSLISGITYEAPYAAGSEWGAYTSASDVWGTDHGIKSSPWCTDANSYWTTSTTTTLRSYDFADSLWTLTEKSLSFCYRVDGVMNVALKDSGGTARYSVNITSGSGRAMIDLTGTGSSYPSGYLEVSLTSGNYCEFSCPQLIDDSSLDTSEYVPFLGTTSGSVEAEIVACSLKVEDLDIGADSVAYTGTSADRDGVLFISGYCQPMFSGDYVVNSNLNTIIQSFGYDTNLKLNIGYDGSTGLEWALYYDGTERQAVSISGHRQGDVYAFGLWSGYADGTANTQMYIVRLRDGATYGGSYIGSMITCHTLWIGSDAGTAQSDCILSGITVESAKSSDCSNAVTRLSNAVVRNVIRNTCGRWYALDRNTSPKQYTPEANVGSYSCQEVRVI